MISISGSTAKGEEENERDGRKKEPRDRGRGIRPASDRRRQVSQGDVASRWTESRKRDRKAQRKGCFGKRSPGSKELGRGGQDHCASPTPFWSFIHFSAPHRLWPPSALCPQGWEPVSSTPCLALVDLGWYQLCNRALGPKIKGFPSLLLGLQSLWGMEATWGVYVPWTLGPQALPALSSGPALWH